jgi:hypothetical protein
MILPTQSYAEQAKTWPQSGRHILAHYDEQTIVVYQAYRPSIGRHAAEHGTFGNGFSYERMSWIKPNFLWMMYRSDWGRAEGQEVVLAIRLRRQFFDELLAQAVPSSYVAEMYPTRDEWHDALRRSSVRLQWDPDHLPTGEKCVRRAIQLGLRGAALGAYGKSETLEIADVSPFVAEQRSNAPTWHDGRLLTPVGRVYVPTDLRVSAKIGLELGPDA